MKERLILRAVIDGQPVGKGRPRFNGHAYTPKKTREWTDRAVYTFLGTAWASVPAFPHRVVIHAISKRPKKLHRKRDPEGLMLRTAKPDGDNVEKAVLDALVKAKVIHDDALVCECRWVSLYAEKGGRARVYVSVYEVDSPDRAWVSEAAHGR